MEPSLSICQRRYSWEYTLPETNESMATMIKCFMSYIKSGKFYCCQTYSMFINKRSRNRLCKMKPTLFCGGVLGRNPGIEPNGKSSSSRQMLRYRSHVIRRGKQQDNIHASAVIASALSIKSLNYKCTGRHNSSNRLSSRAISEGSARRQYGLLNPPPISTEHQLHPTGYEPSTRNYCLLPIAYH